MNYWCVGFSCATIKWFKGIDFFCIFECSWIQHANQLAKVIMIILSIIVITGSNNHKSIWCLILWQWGITYLSTFWVNGIMSNTCISLKFSSLLKDLRWVLAGSLIIWHMHYLKRWWSILQIWWLVSVNIVSILVILQTSLDVYGHF